MQVSERRRAEKEARGIRCSPLHNIHYPASSSAFNLVNYVVLPTRLLLGTEAVCTNKSYQKLIIMQVPQRVVR